MTWTSTFPGSFGWYWLRRPGSERVRLVCIGQSAQGTGWACVEAAPDQEPRLVPMPTAPWEWSERIVWPRAIRMANA